MTDCDLYRQVFAERFGDGHDERFTDAPVEERVTGALPEDSDALRQVRRRRLLAERRERDRERAKPRYAE